MQLMTTTSAIALQYAVFRNIKMTEKPMVSRKGCYEVLIISASK